MRRPVLGPALTVLGADQLGDLELHHLRATALTASRITSACSSSNTFLTTSSIVILSAPAIAAPPFVDTVRSPTILSAASAGTTFRPTPTYTTLRDVTWNAPASPAAKLGHAPLSDWLS